MGVPINPLQAIIAEGLATENPCTRHLIIPERDCTTRASTLLHNRQVAALYTLQRPVMELSSVLEPSPLSIPSPKSTSPQITLHNVKPFSNPTQSRTQHPHPPPPPALPQELTITPLTTPHLSSFRRLTSLLLPIRYPDKFYTETISDTTVSSLSRVAVWRDLPLRPGKRKRQNEEDDGEDTNPETAQKGLGEGKVVGGIRCRLETDIATVEGGRKEGRRVYVQTLCLLSPYRRMGIGTALLDAVVRVGIKEYGITCIYAHVWEANTEALEWYQKRGFEVGDVERGYYRRLKPDGARVVRRGLGVRDYLAVERCLGDIGDNQNEVESARANAQHAGAGRVKSGSPRLEPV